MGTPLLPCEGQNKYAGSKAKGHWTGGQSLSEELTGGGGVQPGELSSSGTWMYNEGFGSGKAFLPLMVCGSIVKIPNTIQLALFSAFVIENNHNKQLL